MNWTQKQLLAQHCFQKLLFAVRGNDTAAHLTQLTAGRKKKQSREWCAGSQFRTAYTLDISTE
jgi:hypothetical protein